jgi:hypothetical protein
MLSSQLRQFHSGERLPKMNQPNTGDRRFSQRRPEKDRTHVTVKETDDSAAAGLGNATRQKETRKLNLIWWI